MENPMNNIVEMFTSARVKLTLWYSLLLLIVSIFLSSIVYFRVSAVVQSEYSRLNERIQQQWDTLPPQAKQRALDTLRIGAQDLIQVRRRILRQLLLVNAGIFIFFSGAGYIMSGITLRPIREAHEEQRRFVGDAAHELKTPITALKTTLEVNILNKKLSKEAQKVLKMNLQDIISLEMLTSSLLQLAQATDTQVELTTVLVKDVVQSATVFLKAIADKRSVSIKIKKIDQQLQARVHEGMLFDLLIILLDNAIKYSNPGSKVVISAVKKGRYCRIEVIDSGVGIPAKDIPHIFERFYRVDNSRTDSQQQGYGLGLAIAKKILTQLKGSIVVSSKMNQGTTFIVSLPLA
jgi:signal transduction histidine kinase